MSKRFRQYTTIRTDTMEDKIHWAIFTKDYRGEEVLRALCNQFGIPVREAKIDEMVATSERLERENQ